MRTQSITIPGLECITAHVEHILANTAASVYWKDKEGKYLGVNEVFVKTTALNSCNDIIGHSDLDLIWGEQEALFMQHNDRHVVSTGKPKTIIETAAAYHDKNLRSFLSYKTPLRSRTGKIIGVFGLSYILDGTEAISKEIESAGFPSDYAVLNKLQALPDETHYELTARQSDCLFYLVKGYSVKQIAKVLLLSPRTVEHYLENVKQKLNCDTRTEMIEKAFRLKQIRERL